MEALRGETLKVQGSSEQLREQAKAYIQLHLGNHDLSPDSIARQFGVSARYLHKAFSQSTTTVGAVIRDERLQRCRAALRDPLSDSKRIATIAAECGFEDAAYFSQVYRRRFGISPSVERSAKAKSR